MTVTYRFPIDLFYQNDRLKEVSELMGKFGVPMQVGLGGEAGHTDVNISSKDDTEPVVPNDKLIKMQEILQGVYEEIIEKNNIKEFKLTVKRGYKL